MCQNCDRLGAKPGDPCEVCGAKDSVLIAGGLLKAACVPCWQAWKLHDDRRDLESPLYALLNRIDVAAYPVKMRLGVRIGRVFSQMLVPSRDRPDVYMCIGNDMWGVDAGLSEEDFFIGVRKGLRTTILHELDEHMKVDGRLLFDPHVFQERYKEIHATNITNTPVVAPDDPRLPGYPALTPPVAPIAPRVKVFINGTPVKFEPGSEWRGSKRRRGPVSFLGPEAEVVKPPTPQDLLDVFAKMGIP